MVFVHFLIIFIVEKCEFCSRQHLISKYGMVGEQKSVDGSKDIGTTAIYFSTDMGYTNFIEQDDNNNITVIKVSGTGGHTIDTDTNKYILILINLLV